MLNRTELRIPGAVRGYYPIVLAMASRPCLVVGGGPVAEAKVEGLLAAQAHVTVVSPTLTERLADLAATGQVGHTAREYRPEDLAGQHLAFVATGDPSVAESVARDGRERGVWVNAADDPARCDFILPSVLRRGRLMVAVSTGGASPGLARAIREALEACLPGDYAQLVELVAEVRQELRGHLDPSTQPAPEAWRRALEPELRRLIADGRRDEAKALLRARLRSDALPPPGALA